MPYPVENVGSDSPRPEVSDLPILLVTPVWMDSRRLGLFGPNLARALAESKLPVRWIVSDDGSPESERAKLSRLVDQLRSEYRNIDLFLCETRSYKGGAIYSAWDSCPGAKWLAYADADGAVDAETVIHLLRLAFHQETEKAYAGVRRKREGRSVRRKPLRSVSLFVFAGMVRLLTGFRCFDTQCGLKALPAAAYFKLAGRLKERGYVFDVELLSALSENGCSIVEEPVSWREVSGTKVRLLHDAMVMLRGLWRIRRRIRSAHYRVD